MGSTIARRMTCCVRRTARRHWPRRANSTRWRIRSGALSAGATWCAALTRTSGTNREGGAARRLNIARRTSPSLKPQPLTTSFTAHDCPHLHRMRSGSSASQRRLLRERLSVEQHDLLVRSVRRRERVQPVLRRDPAANAAVAAATVATVATSATALAATHVQARV